MVPWINGALDRGLGSMAPCPGDGIGQVLFCMGNTEISVQLAGQYYCGGGVVAAAIGVVAAVNPLKIP